MITEARWRTTLTAAVASAVVIAAVIAMGLILRSGPGWTSAEMGVLRVVNLHHTAALDVFALAVDWLFGPPMAVVLSVLGAIVILATTRRPQIATRFVVIVLVSWLGTEVVKLVVDRPRPNIPSLTHVQILEPGGLSFPSGHTSFVACLVIGGIVVTRGRRRRPMLAGAGAVVVLAVASSRVYLGVHYPTDVAASIVYAIAAVTLTNCLWTLLVVPHWSERRPRSDSIPEYRGVSDVR